MFARQAASAARIVFAALCGALPAACASAPPPAGQVAIPAAPPAGEVRGYTGLADSELRIAFGTPAFVRKDGNAEMWRYDGAACKAFFFLYPQGARKIVRHVETLPHGADIAADASCLGALRVHAPPPPVS